MAWIGAAVGVALSSVGTIAANISGDKTRKELNALGAVDPQYQQSDYAKQRYGLAQSLLNARMPGAVATEQNIAATGANTNAAVERTGTDSSQALSLISANQGATDNQYQQQGLNEAANYDQRLNNFNQGADAMTAENQKTYEDNVRRWQDKINISLQRHAIRQQQGQNMSNLGSSISSMGGAMGGGGAGGGK